MKGAYVHCVHEPCTTLWVANHIPTVVSDTSTMTAARSWLRLRRFACHLLR